MRYLRTWSEGLERLRETAKGAICKWAAFPESPTRKKKQQISESEFF